MFPNFQVIARENKQTAGLGIDYKFSDMIDDYANGSNNNHHKASGANSTSARATPTRTSGTVTTMRTPTATTRLPYPLPSTRSPAYPAVPKAAATAAVTTSTSSKVARSSHQQQQHAGNLSGVKMF